ncbi:unnamed protein product [Parascedosporium putredinis]|uniref:PIPK domain-containing protein n=1 Tax=Parascedosporium putredinis TaxID=1442378 RepID=A0A9P1HBX9_9PEZI|nr:unnamed protein product [Parascedosporium putredinis]CAI8002749.1 unnamed protein product [Parascedosporium putredinis]
MGFSGSTFFETRDAKYLIKSVPRHSEHSFFKNDLLEPYEAHMASHHDSLLVRVFDFLGAVGPSIGRFLRLAPSHHIVMENILCGKGENDHDDEVEWKTWDLKPTSYFYPERDIADGRLTSEATKDQLADTFNGKIILTKNEVQDFFSSLNADTEFLARHNAVDYSLFLVRTTYNNGAPA